jgi:hypothetical protein
MQQGVDWCVAQWQLPEDVRKIPVVSALLDSGNDAVPSLLRLQKDASGVMHLSLNEGSSPHLQKCVPHPHHA